MTGQDPPDREAQQTSALAEAVEQAAGVVTKWSGDITRLLKDEANRLSAGDYRLNDLATVPMKLMQIWVANSINAAFAVSDNIALISTARSGVPPPARTMRVPVRIPANTAVKLAPSELTSRSGHRIPPSCIQVEPPDNFPAEPDARDINVVVTVSSPHAPNDVYKGFLRSVEPPIEVPFVVAIYELGEPLL
jgi:hypothetical protein